jgi:hypothetical protein
MTLCTKQGPELSLDKPPVDFKKQEIMLKTERRPSLGDPALPEKKKKEKLHRSNSKSSDMPRRSCSNIDNQIPINYIVQAMHIPSSVANHLSRSKSGIHGISSNKPRAKSWTTCSLSTTDEKSQSGIEGISSNKPIQNAWTTCSLSTADDENSKSGIEGISSNKPRAKSWTTYSLSTTDEKSQSGIQGFSRNKPHENAWTTCSLSTEGGKSQSGIRGISRNKPHENAWSTFSLSTTDEKSKSGIQGFSSNKPHENAWTTCSLSTTEEKSKSGIQGISSNKAHENAWTTCSLSNEGEKYQSDFQGIRSKPHDNAWTTCSLSTEGEKYKSTFQGMWSKPHVNAWTTCSLSTEGEKSYCTQRHSNSAGDSPLLAASDNSDSNPGKPVRQPGGKIHKQPSSSFEWLSTGSMVDTDNTLSIVSSQDVQESDLAKNLASAPIATSSVSTGQFFDNVDNLGSLEHLVQELQDALHLAKKALSLQNKHSEQLATMRQPFQHSVSLPVVPALLAPPAPYSPVPQHAPDPGPKPVKLNGFHKILRSLSSYRPRGKKGIESDARQGSSMEPQTERRSGSSLEPQIKRHGASFEPWKTSDVPGTFHVNEVHPAPRGLIRTTFIEPRLMRDGATRRPPEAGQAKAQGNDHTTKEEQRLATSNSTKSSKSLAPATEAEMNDPWRSLVSPTPDVATADDWLGRMIL